MAKRALRRTVAGKVSLTKEGLQKIKTIAFSNCRTVDQELTYMIEKMLEGSAAGRIFTTNGTDTSNTYDGQQETQPAAFEPMGSEASDASWSPDDDVSIASLAKANDISEAQLSAYKFLHKTPDAVRGAILADKAVPA